MGYQLQYLSRNGWWTGAKDMEIKDIRGYIAGVNANARPARAIDNETGEIIGGDVDPCAWCGAVHLGNDGSCLL